MRTRNEFQRAIVISAIVQVQAEGNHAFQYFRWRMDMNDSFFNGPSSEATNFDSFGYGDDQILVPGDEPICIRILIEENGPNWKWSQTSCRLQQRDHLSVVRELLNNWRTAKQIPETANFACCQFLLRVKKRRQTIRYGAAFLRREKSSCKAKTIALQSS